MTWLNVDVQFGNRSKFLTLSHRLRAATPIIDQLRVSSDPDAVEKVCRDLIAATRPELREASLFYMGWSSTHLAFLIGVEHPSLPPVAPGSVIPCEPLFQEGR